MGNATPSAPPPDLMKERDEVLQSFSRGARLTEHFVEEYTRMHERVVELETDNGKLRAQLEADDAMARLLEQVERLEEERKELLSRTQKAEEAQGQFNEQFSEVEDQFASLANLFVASNQLHASLSPRGVVRRIKEVLAQLVGADAYAMYFLNADGTELVPIASEGVPGNQLTPLRVDDSRVGQVMRSGVAHVDEDRDSTQLNMSDPPAIVPLVVDDSIVG